MSVFLFIPYGETEFSHSINLFLSTGYKPNLLVIACGIRSPWRNGAWQSRATERGFAPFQFG